MIYVYSMAIETDLGDAVEKAEEFVESGAWQQFWDTLPEKALNLGLRIVLAVIFFFVGVQLIKLIRKLIVKSMKRANAELGAIQFVDSFVKAALYVVLVFLLASSFGVDAASIVAILGSAGVAIGLAVQGSLSNLAGGVLILMLKPFRVGDYIIENTTGLEGTVTEIQIFYTKLQTVDNRIEVLPNGNLANNSLTNVTAAHCRRLDIPLSVSYQADIGQTREALEEVLKKDPKILQDREMRVVVDELGDYGVKLIVRCWFANEDYWDGKWRLTEECKCVLDREGIEIPFPQLDVHIR